MSKPVKAKPNLILRMVRRGMTDKEIAGRLGVTNPRTIAKKRSAILGIKRTGGAKPKAKLEVVRIMVKQGMEDEQIGERLGMTTPSIAKIRRTKLGIFKKRAPVFNRERIAYFLKIGYTDREIGKEFNADSFHIALIRRKEFGIGFPLKGDSRRIIRQIAFMIRRKKGTVDRVMNRYKVNKQSAMYLIARTKRKIGTPLI